MTPKPNLEERRDLAKDPVSRVVWVKRDTLVPNDYNPNKLAPPERELLIVSILADGWTMPIVVLPRPRGSKASTPREICDGQHRWEIATDPRLVARYGEMVPTTEVPADQVHRRMSTIRHNRARGTHAILPMAAIVRDIVAEGVSVKDIRTGLGMESEEVTRLSDRAGMLEAGSSPDGFGKAWVPTAQAPREES